MWFDFAANAVGDRDGKVKVDGEAGLGWDGEWVWCGKVVSDGTVGGASGNFRVVAAELDDDVGSFWGG